MNKLATVLLSVLAASLAGAVNPTGEIDVVFPRNETYGVVAPFPIVFGLRNVPARFPMDFTWTLHCRYSTFSGTDSMDGGFIPQGHAEPFYVLNSTQFWYDRAPDDLKNKNGPLGEWLSDKDECILSWRYSAATCQELSDGTGMITTPPGVLGNVTFYLQPGGRPPHDAIAAYKGCPVAAVAFADNSTKGCIDSYKVTPDVHPCGLDVKAAASSIAAGIAAPSTTITALPPTTFFSTSASQVSSH